MTNTSETKKTKKKTKKKKSKVKKSTKVKKEEDEESIESEIVNSVSDEEVEVDGNQIVKIYIDDDNMLLEDAEEGDGRELYYHAGNNHVLERDDNDEFVQIGSIEDGQFIES